MSRFYPVALRVEGLLCVVVGGGGVGERKVAGLLDAGARVRVVSVNLTSELQSLHDLGRIEVVLEQYRAELLEGAHLVFAATDNRNVNARVAADASAVGLLVNSADAPEEGTFMVPSVVRRGEFSVSISTGGNNPMLAARICREMETRFGPEYGAFVELLGELRDTIKRLTTDSDLRRAAVGALLDDEQEIRSRLAAGKAEDARALASSIVSRVIGRSENGSTG